MNPRCFMIKSQNKEFMQALQFQLQEVKQIRFFSFKMNGFYTITVQCYNYYNQQAIFQKDKLYGSYIFLYSIVSIMLSDLFLLHYEPLVSHRFLSAWKDEDVDWSKLASITSLLLDENSPFDFARLLYQKRKRFLLDSILENFRKRNYLFVDYFLDFSSPDYREELRNITEASLAILENKSLYYYMMQFIFQR